MNKKQGEEQTPREETHAKDPTAVCALGGLLAVIFFCLMFYLQIQAGNAASDYIEIPGIFHHLLWISLLACIVMFFIASLSMALLNKGRKMNPGIMKAVLAIFLVFELMTAIGWGMAYRYATRQDQLDSDAAISLSLEELEGVLTDTTAERVYLYVGRRSCQECASMIPQLVDVIEENEISLFYYSTEFDRNTRYADMMQVLNRWGVTSVPMILVIEKGEIVASFDGAEGAEELREWIGK